MCNCNGGTTPTATAATDTDFPPSLPILIVMGVAIVGVAALGTLRGSAAKSALRRQSAENARVSAKIRAWSKK